MSTVDTCTRSGRAPRTGFHPSRRRSGTDDHHGGDGGEDHGFYDHVGDDVDEEEGRISTKQ